MAERKPLLEGLRELDADERKVFEEFVRTMREQIIPEIVLVTEERARRAHMIRLGLNPSVEYIPRPVVEELREAALRLYLVETWAAPEDREIGLPGALALLKSALDNMSHAPMNYRGASSRIETSVRQIERAITRIRESAARLGT